MPNRDTFSIPPIRDFVKRYLAGPTLSVDPFARNEGLATWTNDLNPDTQADYHLDAEAFLSMLAERGVRADVVLFDPPYSPRQVVECYKSIGLDTATAGRSGELYGRVRNAIVTICAASATVLSFGWNTVGMGKKHGFEIVEIMLVCHGGAHNDTICLAERRIQAELAQGRLL
jgi:hypothetical protein